MKKIFITIMIVFISLIWKNVYAIDACTTNEMSRLRELAGNVEFKTSYEFDDVDNEYKNVFIFYDIDILNFSDDLKITYELDGTEYELFSDDKKIEDLWEGLNLTFNIYSYTDNLCTERLLKTVKVNLPFYSDYYYFNKDKCNNHKDFKYCQEFISIEDREYEDIDKLFQEQVISLENNKDDNNEIIKSKNIYIYIIIGVILIILGISIPIIVSKRKHDDI